jgi:DNA-directed RNA polymerase specialized sigma24 family protein
MDHCWAGGVAYSQRSATRPEIVAQLDPQVLARRIAEEVLASLGVPALAARLDELRLGERLSTLQADLSALVQQRTIKDYYTTEEVAEILGRTTYTVREWCRLGRVRASKRLTGRGRSEDWAISYDELKRYQNEGLLPFRR